jgi:hypothetical protein
MVYVFETKGSPRRIASRHRRSYLPSRPRGLLVSTPNVLIGAMSRGMKKPMSRDSDVSDLVEWGR